MELDIRIETKDEVKKALKVIKGSKSAGDDHVSQISRKTAWRLFLKRSRIAVILKDSVEIALEKLATIDTQ